MAPIYASSHGVLVERVKWQTARPGGEGATHADPVGPAPVRRRLQKVQPADDNGEREIVASLASPIQTIAILSLIVLVQLSWLLALGYVVIRFTL